MVYNAAYKMALPSRKTLLPVYFDIKPPFRKRNKPLTLGLIMPSQFIDMDKRNFLRFEYLFVIRYCFRCLDKDELIF